MQLTSEIASKFARIALGHVGREYPNKLDHVLVEPEDARTPRDLHPIFFGSFDWHSCVHTYWLLLTLRRLHPNIAEAAEVSDLADRMFTAESVEAERAYLDRPSSGGFERPYGWAWLLALHGEAAHHDAPWADRLRPLAEAFAARFKAFLPKQTYPIRTGTHFNTAFALILALQWARAHDESLAALIEARAADYYADDRDCPAWEPGGDEFLSAALVEALLMKRVMQEPEFITWLTAFLPRLEQGEPQALFTPATVSDRSDGKIAHLDGFNFTRAWCWRCLAGSLDRSLANDAADRHLAASFPYVAGDYMGEHWLATFALLALTAKDHA
jgi:hypothetical protein